MCQGLARPWDNVPRPCKHLPEVVTKKYHTSACPDKSMSYTNCFGIVWRCLAGACGSVAHKICKGRDPPFLTIVSWCRRRLDTGERCGTQLGALGARSWVRPVVQSSAAWRTEQRLRGGGIFGMFQGASRRANPRLAPRARPHAARAPGVEGADETGGWSSFPTTVSGHP
eukprot:gene12591-biopygen429